ncbi:ceramide glucosyltransferase-B-like [Physella acuta]|uniref:ceramide glucosyltransferase-B-like n=1 Tax=Physella acuta TaxID=109671 RepID=UPI0027DAC538|nr:ceramide glucosyltransferase-B-like [Physella acuta]
MSVDYFAIGATVIASAFLIGWLCQWAIHIVSICFGLCHLYKKLEPVIPKEKLPGISIIKPLTGVDINLKSNLETFFTQTYPVYELLFSVQDDNDPAILVVKSLIDSYPKVDAKLFIGLKNVGPNGKINNMVRPYEAAQYDNIVISDTGIKMTPTTLYEMYHLLKPDVGLVIQMPYCATRKGFGAVYQQVYFGTMQARNCLSANAVGINCSTGMSSLLRRDVLDKAGGLAEFGKYLAEDHFMAEAIRAQNYKVVLATTPALQNSGNCSISEFHNRLVRWAQLRMTMVPTLIFLEPLGESVVLGTFTALAANFIFDISPLAFFLGHFLLWFLSDYILFRIVENGPMPFSKFEYVVAWLLREFLSPYIILMGHLKDHVVWRNRRYKIKWGGKVVVDNSLENVSVS